jgi:hypothetical protein
MQLGKYSAPPEFIFLVRCLRARLASDLDLAEASIPAGINWDAFVALSAMHRTNTIVGAFLLGSARVPGPIRLALHEAVARNQHRSMVHLIETGKITALFEANGVKVLTLKGPVLSWQVHGDIAWRQAGDLDLLVPNEDVEAADRLLRERGYVRSIPNQSLNASETARFQRRCPHYRFFHTENQIMIELHWRLMSNPGFLPLEFDEVYSGREIVPIGNVAFSTLSAVHLPLHLYCHGAHHGWERLSWVYDMAVLQKTAIQNWPDIMSVASRLGLERVVTLGAALCHRLLQAEIPKAIRDVFCENDRQLASLIQASARFAGALGQTKAPFRWRRLAYAIRLADGWRYQRGVLMEHVLQVTRLPFAPGFLLPFYALLRPLFWLRRKINHVG